ncbi:MAG: 30S ribosomal protein S17 [bacterium]|nr:30S ribosomal protein S17 [bacterium]MDA1024563.1 30S ribosomal protein S17 [bacterium]
MSETKTQLKRRRLNGVVVSDKMDKTVVVRVDRAHQHPKYLKRFSLSKKYKAHDEENAYKAGDKVIIEETRPLAKSKTWRVVSKIA